MPGRSDGAIKSRHRNGKRPQQARSAATVKAILEAAVQVLVMTGVDRLTTTRVAERAGVSVGTIYQYFPNKQALLSVTLTRHFEIIAESVEQACLRCRGETMTVVADALVEAFTRSMIDRPDETRAVFVVALEPGNAPIVHAFSDRLQLAVTELLTSVEDVAIDDPASVGFTLNSAIAGFARASIERGISPAVLRTFQVELRTLIQGYLTQFLDK